MIDELVTLVVANDAAEDGQWLQAAALRSSVEIECAYNGPRPRVPPLHEPRFYPDTWESRWDDLWDDDEPPLPLAEQRRRHRRECEAIEWLAWREPFEPATLTTFDNIIRQLYPAGAVQNMAARPMPFFGVDRRQFYERVSIGDDSGDGFEVRVRSYVNLQSTSPGHSAIFSGDLLAEGDD